MENLKGRDADVRIIVKCILKKQVLRLWTGFIWPTIYSSGGLFWTW